MRKILVVLGMMALSVTASAKNDASVVALKKFFEAEQKVKSMYVDTIDENKAVENALRGMLEGLDPHSVYIPREEVQQMTEPLEGEFEGVGITFTMQRDTLHVENTIEGGPSEKVGIRAGDQIVKVNDTVIAGVKKTTHEVMKMLRGKKGTKVVVSVKRKGEKEDLTFHITRDKVPLKSVTVGYLLDPTTGYVRITRFSETTKKEWNEVIKELKKQGMKDIVIDLRGNGGGYLQMATAIADDFLDGKMDIVRTKGRVLNIVYHSSTGGSMKDAKVALLVDEYTASASEILSGALQDWDRGVVVGRRTFGKGLVQQQIKLNDGSLMRVTVARYYTPSGRCIQKPYENGIEAYKSDAEERMKHGELMNADSVKLADSLQYKTMVKGRTVYGGGGIMPDVFVPADTTLNSKYLSNVVAKGVLNTYSTMMAEDRERNYGERYGTLKRFEAEMEVDDNMLNGLRAEAAEEEVTCTDEEWERAKEKSRMFLKALIARRIWGEEGYYTIVNGQDETVKKAVEELRGQK